MSQKPISPLRRRMIEDMTVRKFVEKTRDDYIRPVKTFAAFLGRSPDTATAEDLRLFQLHSERDRRPSADHQWFGCSPALLLYRDARPRRYGPPPHFRARAGQSAGSAEPRGGGAPARGGSRTEV
jgi:Phage integrase, N-terminal SAM-like domain